MREYSIIFNSLGELAVVNERIGTESVSNEGLKVGIEEALTTGEDNGVDWKRVISLLDHDYDEGACHIYIYSNVDFYKELISEIYKYENMKDTKFSVEFRYSPVIVDNRLHKDIVDKEDKVYHYVEEKIEFFMDIDDDYYYPDVLKYVFNSIYTYTAETFKVNLPVEEMAIISQKKIFKKYICDANHEIKIFSGLREKMEDDIYSAFAAFFSVCVGVQSGEIFFYSDKSINAELIARIEARLKGADFNFIQFH